MVKQDFVGIVKGFSNSDYHACNALGASTINKRRQSAAHVKAALDKKLIFNQRRMDIGTCGHSLVLEQDTSKFVCGPSVSSRAVKAWKEFEAANPDKIVLTPEEHQNLIELFDKFCAHPFASQIIDKARVEESHFVIDPLTGIWLKARPDAFIEKNNFIVDYKTAQSAKPHDFSKAIFNYGYDISAIHYIEVVQQTTGIAVDEFYWIVQEIKPPFELMVFRASQELLARARYQRNEYLMDIQQCFKTNVWPGYATEIHDIDIPMFLVSDMEEPDFGGVA